MRIVTNTVSNAGLSAIFRKDADSQVSELLLVPEGLEDKVIRDDCPPEPLVQAKVIGDDYAGGYAQGRTMRDSPTIANLRMAAQQVSRTDRGAVLVTTHMIDDRGLEYVHELEFGRLSSTVQIRTSVINHTNSPITLEMLSSFTLGSLSPFLEGISTGTLKLHRLRSTWSAEGRLETGSVEELQLEPDWQEHVANTLRFGAVGSFPVRVWAPFVAVEDVVNGITWAASTTQGSSWQLEVSRKSKGLSLSGGLADREFGHWMHTLGPGATFTAPAAVLTVVRGGVDEAGQVLASHIKENLELPDSERDELPIVFNEFCSTWGKPSELSVLSQMNELKNHGVDYLVIDAGWFDDQSFTDSSRLGKWQVNKTAFPHGMKYVVDAIHQAGMKAGIWFEFEVAGRQEIECFEKTDWLLHRDGIPITSGDRRFLDMRNPSVRSYLHDKVIDFLRSNGFDYLKIDYNETIGIGCETPCEPGRSLGEGLYDQIQATLSFIRQIRDELPEVVIEVCSSGGHRLVQSFMELGAMGSFSDAHECIEIPLIAANMHRMILPRQSQIWAVMRPELSEDQTRYRLASGFLGRLCLSGNMETLSSAQWGLIDEATSLYRHAAPIIASGESRFFGTKVGSYREPEGWQAVLRKSTQSDDYLLVLHTFADAPSSVAIPFDGPMGRVELFADQDTRLSFNKGALQMNGLCDFSAAVALIHDMK